MLILFLSLVPALFCLPRSPPYSPFLLSFYPQLFPESACSAYSEEQNIGGFALRVGRTFAALPTLLHWESFARVAAAVIGPRAKKKTA